MKISFTSAVVAPTTRPPSERFIIDARPCALVGSVLLGVKWSGAVFASVQNKNTCPSVENRNTNGVHRIRVLRTTYCAINSRDTADGRGNSVVRRVRTKLSATRREQRTESSAIYWRRTCFTGVSLRLDGQRIRPCDVYIRFTDLNYIVFVGDALSRRRDGKRRFNDNNENAR